MAGRVSAPIASCTLAALAMFAGTAACRRGASGEEIARNTWREVLAAFERAGVAPASAPELVLVDVAGMAEVLEREAERRAQAIGSPGDDAIATELRNFALRVARVSPARFDPVARRMLLCLETVDRLAAERLGDVRERRRLLRGVLLHEAAHVRLEDRFGLFGRLTEAKSPAQLGRAELFAEAAAQALAEWVGRAQGWSAEAALGVPPADESPEGRAFRAALEEARVLLERGGEEALAAAFESRWAAAGSVEPAPEPAAEAAFRVVLDRFGDGDVRRFETPRPAIRASLAFLPDDEARRLAESVEFDRSLRWQARGGEPRRVGCSLRRHVDAQAAGDLYAALRNAFGAQEGLSLHPFGSEGVRGFLVEDVTDPSSGTRVVSALAVGSRLSLMLLFDGVTLTQEDARALALEALEAALRHEEESASGR